VKRNGSENSQLFDLSNGMVRKIYRLRYCAGESQEN